MARSAALLKRVGFAVLAIYLVLSATFGFMMLAQDPQVARIAYAVGHSPEAQRASFEERQEMVAQAIQRYKEAHGLDEPLHVQYVRWMIDITTLDWGDSFHQNRKVTDIIAASLQDTLSFVIPAILIGLIGSLTLGVYAAMNQRSMLAKLLTTGSYLGYGIPNFWLAEVLLLVGVLGIMEVVGITGQLAIYTLASFVLGLSLLAAQLRYVRAEAREYLFSEFVTLIRAKGATNFVVGKHLLKNAALPLTSLFFSELLGVMVVNIFILERVLGITGIGYIGLRAIQEQDLPVVLGIAVIIAILGVVGNLIQDVINMIVDPRIQVE
ncbi:MAG: ABC transporter permease [Halodesulfurarchaeum sp.]